VTPSQDGTLLIEESQFIIFLGKWIVQLFYPDSINRSQLSRHTMNPNLWLKEKVRGFRIRILSDRALIQKIERDTIVIIDRTDTHAKSNIFSDDLTKPSTIQRNAHLKSMSGLTDPFIFLSLISCPCSTDIYYRCVLRPIWHNNKGKTDRAWLCFGVQGG
jgi:hypothetical protein